jgi:hypothetical protein
MSWHQVGQYADVAIPKTAICIRRRKNLVPKLVPDSTELSRTPWTRFALPGQIRLYRRVPARLIIRRSLVRVQPAPSRNRAKSQVVAAFGEDCDSLRDSLKVAVNLEVPDAVDGPPELIELAIDFAVALHVASDLVVPVVA